MLDSARSELKSLIDLKQSTVWDKLKKKCGINSSGRWGRRRKCWGEASDYFVSSGLLPEDSYQTVDSLKEFGDVSNEANKTEIENLVVSGSGPAATITRNDYNDDVKDNIHDSDTDDYEVSDLNNTAKLYATGPNTSSTDTLRTLDIENLVETETELPHMNNTFNLDAAGPSPGGLKTIDNENLTKTETALKNTVNLKTAGPSPSSNTLRTEGNENLIERKSNKRKHDIQEGDGKYSGKDIDAEINRNSPDTFECNDNQSLTNKKAKNSESKISTKLLRHANEIELKANKNHGTLTVDSVKIPDTEIGVEDCEPVDNETGNKILFINLDKDDTSSLTKSVTESGMAVQRHMSDSELKFESLKNKYKCDLCLAVSVSSERMFTHLKESLHYSASLVSVDEKGIPVNTVRQYALICRSATFKTLIPVCPEPACPLVFLNIYACATHYNVCHKPDEGAVYAVAELLQEDTIKSENLLKVCKVCSEEFPTRELLRNHIRNEAHLPYTVKNNTHTIFMCSGCKFTFTNFFKALTNHGHKRKKRHIADFKVLHISLNRMKKSILPYKTSSAAQLTCIKSEIHNLKKLRKQAGKEAKRQMLMKIEELHRVRFDSGNQGKMTRKPRIKRT